MFPLVTLSYNKNVYKNPQGHIKMHFCSTKQQWPYKPQLTPINKLIFPSDSMGFVEQSISGLGLSLQTFRKIYLNLIMLILV